MSTKWRTDAFVMASIVLIGCAATALWGERIGVNGGQGWDGMAYTAWAQDFWHRVIVEGLTRYHSQRVLPSAIVHYALRIAGKAPTPEHIINGFIVLNTCLLVYCAVVWAHLGHYLKCRREAVWAGFIALFLCFANARHALYYPTLTDPMAFALGMTTAWGFLSGRSWAVWLSGVLAVPTWPALPPLAIILLIFPAKPPAEGATPRACVRLGVSALAATVCALIFIGVGLHYLGHPVPGVGDEKFAEWVHRDLLVVTIPSLFLVLGGGVMVLLSQETLWQFRPRFSKTNLRAPATAGFLALSIVALRVIWVAAIGTHGEGPTTAQFLCEHTLAALRGPLWGPVHHVVYFGPIVVVAVLFWKQICGCASRLGPGAVLSMAVTVAFVAGSNSRQWNHLFPFLVSLTILATQSLWTWRSVLVFAAIAVAWSKVWIKLGYDVHIAFWNFPNQRFFMNHGPYASDTMYVVHLCAAVVTAGAVILMLRIAKDPQ